MMERVGDRSVDSFLRFSVRLPTSTSLILNSIFFFYGSPYFDRRFFIHINILRRGIKSILRL